MSAAPERISPASIADASASGGAVQFAPPAKKKLKFFCDTDSSLHYKGDGCPDPIDEPWPCTQKPNGKWEDGEEL
ncbi:MAG: hypothetical protein NTY19_49350 [Planctomycetota bacterium]|nr:hypothetical protein [Planctomycetota bacterium]